MIQIIKEEFSDRVKEIDRYYRLLENIETGVTLYINDRIEGFEIGISSTLKSGAILLLYNLVESTVSKCLNAIHQILSNDEISYFEMSDELQKIWLKYHYDILSEQNLTNDKSIGQLQIMVEVLSANKRIFISQDDSKKLSESLYSGNLDAKEIRKIAKKYGVVFENESNEIRFVEQMRNKLAHGEVSFEEGCRDKPIHYMKKVKEETIKFLEYFMQSVEIYVSDEKYKK